MSRDFALQISNKLAGEWSASSATPLLSSTAIDNIASEQKWNALDPLLRVRLLLAPLFLRPSDVREMLSSLSMLIETASHDKDEWVRIIAAAVNPYDGTLHIEAVKKLSKLIETTLTEVRVAYQKSCPQDVPSSKFRPLEEKYLSDNIMRERIPDWCTYPRAPPHTHFVPREPPGIGAGVEAMQRSQRMSVGHPVGGQPAINAATTDKTMIPPPLPKSQKSSLKDLYAKPGKGVARFGQLKPKKAAIIDVSTVSELNKAAALEKARKQKEEEEAKEEAARAKLAAKLAAKEEAKEKRALVKKSSGEKTLPKGRKRPLSSSEETPAEPSELVSGLTKET